MTVTDARCRCLHVDRAAERGRAEWRCQPQPCDDSWSGPPGTVHLEPDLVDGQADVENEAVERRVGGSREEHRDTPPIVTSAVDLIAVRGAWAGSARGD